MVNSSALVELGEKLPGFTFITVNFPAADTATILPFVLNEALHIIQRVSQKQTDFVRKTVLRNDTACKPFNAIIDAVCFIPIS